MRVPTTSIAQIAVATWSLAGVSCQAAWGGCPPLDGDGSLREFHIPGRRGVLKSVADGDGSHLFFIMTGPRPILCCTDLALNPVSSADGVWDCVAPGGPKHALAYINGSGFQLLSVPDLRSEDELRTGQRSGTGRAFGTDLLPQKDGWIYVEMEGHIVRVQATPLRIAKAGRASLASVKGAAIDSSSGRLLLTGDDKYVEEFDTGRMASIGRWDLGVNAIAGICVGNGMAWIATDEGVFVQFDVARHAVVQTVRVMEGTDKVRVDLDLSPSGKLLAVSATRPLREHQFAAVLKLYRLDAGTLTLLASARATLRWMIYDLTIVESEEMVVLASQSPTLVWRYGKRG